MKCNIIWEDIPCKDKENERVWQVCFSPNGEQIIVACSNKLLVYNTADPSQVSTLKGHKGIVKCVTYAKDGKHFASGSDDKNIIIWTTKLEGIRKFTLSDAALCISYSPIFHILLACCQSEFALVSSEHKILAKEKSDISINCCTWTNDGQFFALGLQNGIISIRNNSGVEKIKIDRSSFGSIWNLKWCPDKDVGDVLAVTDWSQKLSLYSLNGQQLGKDRQLDFDPCTLCWYDKGKYLIIGGSKKEANLYSNEGLFLGKIAEKLGWVWSVDVYPEKAFVAVGSQDGSVSLHSISFISVHNCHHIMYAHRSSMTEVTILNCNNEEKALLKCKDLVRKVSVYKNMLAVQLSDKIVIYETDPGIMNYKIRARFNKKVDCQSLIVLSNNILFGQDRVIQCYSFEGYMVRDWTLESFPRCIKVTGGPPGREGVIFGCKNGQIVQLFIDNAFPVLLLSINISMQFVDINNSHDKIAIVEENGTCLVYSLKNSELLYQELNATTVVWNTCHEEMIGFAGLEFLAIKASTFPVHQQKQQGYVIAFEGPHIYCLEGHKVNKISVPNSAMMYQYLEKKLFKEAYSVASMGVTSNDWDTLGKEALEGLDFEIAKKSFAKTTNIIYLDLMLDIEDRMKRGEANKKVFFGDILALEGRYIEAANVYKSCGHSTKSVNMFTDLRMFDKAKEYLSSDDPTDKRMLMAMQADWVSNLNNPESAAQMYIDAGEYAKAIDIIGENGWAEKLIQLTRKLDKGDRESLIKSAYFLQRLQQYAYAEEILIRLGDEKALAQLQVQAQFWDKAFETAKKYPDLMRDVYLPYACHLAENDKFEEAQKAFYMAGVKNEALKVLRQLIENAVNEKRFTDASFYYWKLSMQYLQLAQTEEEKTEEYLKKFNDLQSKADIYYAYHTIHRYMVQPFSPNSEESLFYISRFLCHSLLHNIPDGVSKFDVLYTLGKLSKSLGALKLGRTVCEMLHNLNPPPRYRDFVDNATLSMRAKPYRDSEDLMLICYYCSSSIPLFNTKGNVCVNCQQPIIFSFITFETLPLVEFFIEENIDYSEALSLLDYQPPSKQLEPHEIKKVNSQSLKLDHKENKDDEEESVDIFSAKKISFEQGGNEYRPIVANKAALKAINRTEVLICDWPKPIGPRFFKIMMEDIPIIKCDSCFKFFHRDDYELLFLQTNKCPFCRKDTIEEL